MAIGIRKKLKRAPLHMQIAEMIREKLKADFRPGERLESESRMAATLGVSVPTVREALSTLAMEGIIERRHGSGTYVAERENKQHVAIFSELDLLHPATSWYFLQVIRQLRQYLEDRNFDTVVYLGHTRTGEKPTGKSCPELISALKRNRISCMFLWGMDGIPRYIDSNIGKDVPVVGGTRSFRYNIIQDHGGLVREGVSILAAQGCKRLAFMGSPSFKKDFMEAVRDKGLVPDIKLVATDFIYIDARSCINAFREIMSDGGSAPDGILIAEDTIYFNVEPLLLKGSYKIPEKLKIVSHGNKGDLRSPFLPITLLQFDPDEYAAKAGEIIDGLLSKNDRVPNSVSMGYHLSTARSIADAYGFI